MTKDGQIANLVYWLGVGFVLGCLSTTLIGCDDGGIPIEPECFVPDECVAQVVEEFCPDTPTHISVQCEEDPTVEEQLYIRYEEGVRDGYVDAVFVLCCNTPIGERPKFCRNADWAPPYDPDFCDG